MAIIAHLAAALSLLSVVGAVPAPPPANPTCGGGPILPDRLFFLYQGLPDESFPTGDNFTLSQVSGPNGTPFNQGFMLIQFSGTPLGASGCQVVVALDKSLTFVKETGGQLQVDVIEITGSVPKEPTWNNVVLANPPLLNGVFGSVNLQPGINEVINTATCVTSGLTFLVKPAQFIEQSNKDVLVDFLGSPYPNNFTDIFVEFNC